MSKLKISFEGRSLGEIPLDKERVSIGRHPDNDIILKDDRAISGHHAVIITIMTDSFLEDMDSTNGTMVNGRQVSKHPLSNGDLVQIGQHHLKYEGQVSNYDEDFEKTMILKPSEIIAATSAAAAKQAPATPPAASGGAAPAAAAAAPAPSARPMLGRVRVENGPNAGKELNLTKALTTLGKPGVQVAAITRRADGYYIVHVGPAGSSNRPKVNAQMISAQAHKLKADDLVEIAGTQMKFQLVPPIGG